MALLNLAVQHVHGKIMQYNTRMPVADTVSQRCCG